MHCTLVVDERALHAHPLSERINVSMTRTLTTLAANLGFFAARPQRSITPFFQVSFALLDQVYRNGLSEQG